MGENTAQILPPVSPQRWRDMSSCRVSAVRRHAVASWLSGRTKSASSVAMALRGIERIFGLVRVLHKDDAAGFLDGLEADRAVGAAACQDDGKAVAMLVRQGAKEQVDRGPLAARLLKRSRGNMVVRDPLHS